MESVEKFVQNNLGIVTLIILSAFLVLGFTAVYLWVQLQRDRRAWKQLLSGSSKGNLETMLSDSLANQKRILAEMKTQSERLDLAEKRLLTSKRFTGIVRYDAFQDVGGNQSFSLALFDDNGDGSVITCLYGRAECRVYAKLLEGGKADRALTQEEQKAIEIAGMGGKGVRAR